MDKYIVLDIESPNTYFNSVSAIGIIVVENNQIIDKIYSLINPEDKFEDEIIDLTGITPEMIKDAPKFNEFWPQIESLLSSNIIIGHNITYDLNVISNSLKNYHITPPDFKYVCTLNLSRQRLENYSYSLPDIMKILNYEYDAHNALADAKAAHYLFNYLEEIKPISLINIQRYVNNFQNDCLSDEFYPNINELYGSILEFRYKDEITENQIKIFQDWIDKNKEYSSNKKINEIIIGLNAFVSKKDINQDDKIELSTLVTGNYMSDKYSREELNSHIFIGISKMLKCDEKISDKEQQFVNKWLSFYDLPKDIDVDKII